VDESRLSRIRLGDDPLMPAMAGGHRLAGRDTVRRTELRSEAFIPVSPPMPTFPAVERHLGFRPQFAAVETADYQAILGLVAAGLGVALVPKTVVEQARRTDVVAAPLAGRQIRRRVEVALPKGGHPPRVTTTLVDALAAATAGLN
jgi:DNA-binding transcriptional LysR family regulator